MHLLCYIIHRAWKALHDLLPFIIVQPLLQVTVTKERKKDFQNSSTSHQVLGLELCSQELGLFQGL